MQNVSCITRYRKIQIKLNKKAIKFYLIAFFIYSFKFDSNTADIESNSVCDVYKEKLERKGQ